MKKRWGGLCIGLALALGAASRDTQAEPATVEVRDSAARLHGETEEGVVSGSVNIGGGRCPLTQAVANPRPMDPGSMKTA